MQKLTIPFKHVRYYLAYTNLVRMIKYYFQCCSILNIFFGIKSRATTVARNGTCYSSTECKDKSGEAAGGCAAG